MSIPSTFACSISGTVPVAPVVARTSGLLFERRLIESHLATAGPVCPVTGAPLTSADLIAVQSSIKGGVAPAGGVSANEVVKPRPPAATSIPGLLSLLQGEWDACMLETFHLKQQVSTETKRAQTVHRKYGRSMASAQLHRTLVACGRRPLTDSCIPLPCCVGSVRA